MKVCKQVLVFFIGCFTVYTLTAQMPGNRGGNGSQLSGRFYGRIVDASNKGIDAASIILVQDKMDTVTKQRKETVVGGMLTTANGDFSIENVPAMARYKLRVSGIGYKMHEQNVNFERPAGNNPSSMLNALDKDLGNIKLEIDDKLLSNVTVEAGRPLLQMGIDRKIFNVDRNLVSAGGTAIDVMKNVPSVSVDIDGNVSLRNNAPQIFVDGRPTTLTLEQIPSDAIESVEIITNPSAKFDASGGTAGILNIVLKKNKRVGYSGNLRTNIDSRGRIGAGGDINIRQNKINVFAGGNFNQRKSISKGSTDRTTFDAVNARTQQFDNTEFNGQFGFGRAGFDYFINNRNTITATGTFARGKMSPEGTSDIFINSDTSYKNLRFTNSVNNFRNMGSQVSFKHLFPKAGNEWTADVTYNEGKNDNTTNILTQNNRISPTPTSLGNYTQLQNSQGNNTNLIFQTDYANLLVKIQSLR